MVLLSHELKDEAGFDPVAILTMIQPWVLVGLVDFATLIWVNLTFSTVRMLRI